MIKRATLKIVRCEHAEGIKAPVQAKPGDAGYDLRSTIDVTLWPGDQVTIPLGFRWQLPTGWCGIIIPKSGLGRKYRAGLANTVGLLDEDYTGEVMADVVDDGNNPDDPWIISRGDSVCQMIILPYWSGAPEEVADLAETVRGAGGFGHTGR